MAAVFALLAAVGWGTSDYAAGSASRRSSAVSVVILTHLTAVVALLLVGVDVGPFWSSIVELVSPDRSGPASIVWPRLAGAPTSTDLAWGVAAGLGGGFGAMLLFRGLGRGSMAVVAPITAAGAASVPVLVGVSTGESLAPTGIAGIALALVAIVLVSLSPAGPEEDTHEPPGGDDELTVPEGWAEEYGWTGAAAGDHGLPGPIADDLIFPGPAPATTTATTYAPRVEIAVPPPSRAAAVPALAAELGITVRSVVGAILTLLIALVVAAAGIAAGPLADLAGGERPSAGRMVMLGFSVATAAIAVSGLRFAKPMLAVAAGLDAGPASAAGAPAAATARPVRVPVWRRALGQPGLPEALLSGLGFGTFYVCISRAGAAAGHWPMISARGISVVLFTAVALATTTAVLPERGSRRFVVLAGVMDAAAAVLFVLATNAGLLSIGAVLASLYPAVTVSLARVHGGERIAGRQYVGLALALGAVALLAA